MGAIDRTDPARDASYLLQRRAQDEEKAKARQARRPKRKPSTKEERLALIKEKGLKRGGLVMFGARPRQIISITPDGFLNLNGDEGQNFSPRSVEPCSK